MARKDLDMVFPKWNPQRSFKDKLESSDPKKVFKALRNTSSGFISRKDVRKIVFERDENKCILCGSTDNLQVDHIVSVYYAFIGRIDIKLLNTSGNLQTLCNKCNSSKYIF